MKDMYIYVWYVIYIIYIYDNIYIYVSDVFNDCFSSLLALWSWDSFWDNWNQTVQKKVIENHNESASLICTGGAGPAAFAEFVYHASPLWTGSLDALDRQNYSDQDDQNCQFSQTVWLQHERRLKWIQWIE